MIMEKCTIIANGQCTKTNAMHKTKALDITIKTHILKYVYKLQKKNGNKKTVSNTTNKKQQAI